MSTFPLPDDEVLHFRATRAWKDSTTLKFTSFDDGNGSEEGLICLARMLLELAEEKREFETLDKYTVDDIQRIQEILERVKVR